jgi:hypothetical protein
MPNRAYIKGAKIDIKGRLSRHEIVKKVVNTFIDSEYKDKGKGVVFRYPVEDLSIGKTLYIIRPTRKWNFDFIVEIPPECNLGKGGHKEIATDLRNKKKENPEKFKELLQSLTEVYNCSENDVDRVLERYPNLQTAFKTGAKIDVVLKVLKWMFIMEDIIYWNYEGRAKLYNFLMEEIHK